MIRAIILLIALTTIPARAENSLLKGGQSPDGHYQVRIFQTNRKDPSDYFFAVVDTKTKKQIKRLPDGGGWAGYDQIKVDSVVLWHKSSTVFAITDRGTKHSRELYIYETTPTDVSLIEQPDYHQNALGRVNATEGYNTAVTNPLEWKGDTLNCSLIFDAVTPDSPRAMFTTTFSLKLSLGDNSKPSLSFTSMGKLKNEF